MISTYTNNKISWIDLENPTKEEVRSVMEKYDLSPEVAEDLLDPTVRTRADIYSDFVYFVLHFPIQTHKKNQPFDRRAEEIDFIIGKNFLITIHYSPIQTLISFNKALETDSLLRHDYITKNSGTLFVHILNKMYTAVQDKISDIQTSLSQYEEDIFNGKEKEMVSELSNINRVLIYFKESLFSHQSIFTTLKSISQNLFGKDFETYTAHLLNEYNKSKLSLESTKSYADELRQTNDSLLSTKQNEIMKTLTVVNFIVLPLTLLAGVFGMNTEHTPITGHPLDFWILASFMFCLGLVAFLIFKRKKWL
jgi:magnesium transporter